MSDQIVNKYGFSQDAMLRQAERIGRTGGTTGVTGNTNVQMPPENSFKDLLNQRITDEQTITFSKHAAMRTMQRNISLSDADVARLGQACDKASQKGIKEALVVMDDSAFIVNTPSKIVVTVVDKNEMKENVFTNIDGALFV